MDVKIAFLNGEVEQEVYIEQFEGFVIHGNVDIMVAAGGIYLHV
jgi:hypothetical protein